MTGTRLTVAAALAVLAASVSLAPAFQTGEFFWPSVGAVAFVAGAGWLARRLHAPRALVLLATVAGLATYLTLAYARDAAVLGVLPGPDAVSSLRRLAESGFEDINRFAAPVRPYEGIVAVTAAGIGLIAVLVDLVAVTLRRAAAAGLPLLALYCVPAAVVREGVGWLPFAVGATGYLALLLVDSADRVGAWGRALGRTATDRPSQRGYRNEVDTTPLTQVGRRVGAAALGIAVVVPALLPNLDDGVWGSGGAGLGNGDASRTVNVINPIVDLRRDLVRSDNRAVIRYRTDDPDPGYLRMATLDAFTGDSWVPARLRATDEQDVRGGLPAPLGLGPDVQARSRRATIAVGDLKDPRLPLPYPAVEIEVDGEWRYDQATRNVFSFRNDTRGLTYDVRSLDLRYDADALRNAADPGQSSGTPGYTQLPNDLPPLVRRLTDEVAGAATSDYDAALALQQWFRDEFTYSLDVRPGNSTSALVDFLRDRSGYCEQFAATMAVMARLEGIPARVNVGFTQGRRLRDGTWQVTLRDAHAWPELYFPGVGWVPFEPTPRADGTTPAPAYADADDLPAPPADPQGAVPAPGTNAPSDNPRSANDGRTRQELELARRRLEGPTPTGGGDPATETRGPRLAPVTLAVAVAGLAFLVLPSTARILIRSRRHRRLAATSDGVGVAWAELEDTAWDHGVPRRPDETPRRFVDRVIREGGLVGASALAAQRLATTCERARFAPTLGEVGALRDDVTLVRCGLSSAADLRTRWRARAMPASSRALATWAAERVADGLDWFDVTLTGARRVMLRWIPGRRHAG